MADLKLTSEHRVAMFKRCREGRDTDPEPSAAILKLVELLAGTVAPMEVFEYDGFQRMARQTARRLPRATLLHDQLCGAIIGPPRPLAFGIQGFTEFQRAINFAWPQQDRPLSG